MLSGPGGHRHRGEGQAKIVRLDRHARLAVWADLADQRSVGTQFGNPIDIEGLLGLALACVATAPGATRVSFRSRTANASSSECVSASTFPKTLISSEVRPGAMCALASRLVGRAMGLSLAGSTVWFCIDLVALAGASRTQDQRIYFP